MNLFETEWERPEFDSVPLLAENAVYLLPGCDDLVLRKTLQVTYRDFCKRSAALRTWRKIELPRNGTEEMPDDCHFRFAIAPVLSGEIDSVTNVEWCGSRRPVRGWKIYGDPPVVVLPRLERHDFFFGGHDGEWVQDKFNVGSLPVEEAKDPPRRNPWAFWVETVEVPHLNEERAPKAFLRRYGDALVDGALARLFAMTGRPWTDAEQARQHGIAYTNALSEARLKSVAGGPTANAAGKSILNMSSMV